MKKLNTTLLSKLSSTFASLRYNGEVKMVKKAREANETLTKAILAHGGKVAEKGEPCPFGTVTKVNQYTVSIGAKLNYKRKVEAMTKRNGVVTDYRPEQRDLGMFPVFGELVWVKNDLSEVYIRAYQTTKPKAAQYFADGKEVAKEILGQWLPSKDFNTLSGLENTVSVVADIDGNIIYCQDEDGNLVLDKDGNPMEMALPEVRAIKLSNCELYRKGEKIEFFTDEEWSESELAQIRDAYYAKFNA
jgi:hypothetical protein